MTLAEIEAAVDAGKTVYWSTPAYRVKRDTTGRLVIAHTSSAYRVGLTHRDGVTMNGKPTDFYIEGGA